MKNDFYHAPTQKDIENIDFLAESFKIAFIASKQNASIVARKVLAEEILKLMKQKEYDKIELMCREILADHRKDRLCAHPYGHFPHNDKNSPFYECEVCGTKVLRFSAMYNGQHHRLIMKEPKVGDLVRAMNGDIFRVMPNGKPLGDYQMDLKTAKAQGLPVLEN